MRFTRPGARYDRVTMVSFQVAGMPRSYRPRGYSNQRSGWRMKKFRTTSSTSESAGSDDHSARYDGSLSATPPKSRLAWRIGQYWSYMTSGGFGQDFLSRMNGAM